MTPELKQLQDEIGYPDKLLMPVEQNLGYILIRIRKLLIEGIEVFKSEWIYFQLAELEDLAYATVLASHIKGDLTLAQQERLYSATVRAIRQIIFEDAKF